MSSGLIVWCALVGGAVAACCAIACAVIAAAVARAPRPAPMVTPRRQLEQRQPVTQQPVFVVQPPPVAPPPPPVVYVLPQPTAAPSAPPQPQQQAGLVLEGHYPQLGRALGGWLQTEADPIARARIARDLGRIGDGGAARALLDGVRTGAITPTIAADNLELGGFDAGIAVAAALRDPEPRVRAFASSIVGRRVPLERLDLPAVPRQES